MLRSFALLCCFVVSVSCLALRTGIAAEPEQLEFFEKEVRPILADRCFKCHGGGENSKGGLKLTSREALLEGGESGPAAVPGNPQKSPMIEAVNYEGLEMPPDRKLDARQIASLTHWVKLGLPWPKLTKPDTSRDKSEGWRKHWPFQPVKLPPAPMVQNANWCRTDVDRFILSKLESQGLTPSPAADKRTLIRRATFDLIGLPPSPTEVQDFLLDNSSQAFEKVVDRLLASPHYGERWGRHWLDIARYADNKGYIFNQDPTYPWAYTYRDYVVRAFNEDLPYNRFIKEQLAADQLEGTDPGSLAAMGFLTLNNWFNGDQQDVRDDRIDVVTRGLLGLTVTCARCHDHKFDPIPTRDYYSLYGIFANSQEPLVPPVLEEQPNTVVTSYYQHELQRRHQQWAEFLEEKRHSLLTTTRERIAEYLVTAQELRDRPPTEAFMEISQQGDLNPVMLVRWRAYLEITAKSFDPVFAPWHALAEIPDAGLASKAGPRITQLLSSNHPAEQVNPIVARELARRRPINLTELAELYAQVFKQVDHEWQRLSAGDISQSSKLGRLPDAAAEQIRQVYYGPRSPLNVPFSMRGDLALLPDRESQAIRDRLVQALQAWLGHAPGAPARAMVLNDTQTRNQQFVFLRGNPTRLGDEAPPRFLECLSGPDRPEFSQGSGRRELAEAIADRANPLTPRVMVNRVWLHHFGAGLVRTPSDFGMRSDPPTHPELLDYLAARFVDSGWSLKKLHRLIMLSAVYQQASAERPELKSIDPENLLLARMNRQRLDFEAMRDALLAASNRLDRSIGGPPVASVLDPSRPRRSLYACVDRLHMPGVYRTFDFPNPDTTSPRRDVTIVPQQALFWMNSPFVSEMAKALAADPLLHTDRPVAAKVDWLYERLYARPSHPAERRFAHAFLAGRTDPKSWQEYSQALLLANEFVFID